MRRDTTKRRRNADSHRLFTAKLGALLLALCALSDPMLIAQTPPDSLFAKKRPIASDSLRIGFRQHDEGEIVGKDLPTTLPPHQVIQRIASFLGGYRYDLGAEGWAHGWSGFGFLPQQTGLQIAGNSFRDLISETPRYDLLPGAWLSPLRFAPEVNNGLPGFSAGFGAFATQATSTEMRYDTGGGGLQSASVLHVQNRYTKWFKKPARTQFLFGIASDKTTNAYANSKSVGSAFLFRLRYERPVFSVELRNLHTRRRGGAHAGVLPSGTDFDTVYDTRIGLVRDAGWNRQTRWNDLALVYRRKWLRKTLKPFTATTFWQSELFRSYTQTVSDTQEVRLHRYGLRFEQPTAKGKIWTLDLFAHHLKPTASIITNTLWWPEARLGLRDSLRWQGFRLTWHANLRWTSDGLLPNGSFRFTKGRFFVQSGAGIEASNRFASSGINRLLVSTPSLARTSAFAWLKVGMRREWEDWQAEVSGFAGSYGQSYAIGTDILAYSASENTTSVGGGVVIGWRNQTTKGFFGRLQTQIQTLTLDTAAPLFSGNAQVGLRFTGFERDLIARTFLQMQFWTRHKGLAWSNRMDVWGKPPEAYPSVPATLRLDVVAEADVRSATLQLSAENLLAGLSFFPGTYQVPIFPLQAQNIRFSIFWPLNE